MAFDAQARSFSQANAQILAQAAAVAYLPPATSEKWAAGHGFTGPFDFVDNQDTQGFVAESDDAILVAFRGTQPNHSMDWFVDAGAVHRPWAHDAGTVHTGFYNALLAVWGAKVDIVPRVPLFSGGYCHYGNNTFFDSSGKSTEQMSAVETLANAFKSGAAVFNLGIVQQAAGAIKLGIGRVLGADTPFEEAEQAFRETARALLRLGVEKIDDHDMKKHYLVRLGTSLPADL